MAKIVSQVLKASLLTSKFVENKNLELKEIEKKEIIPSLVKIPDLSPSARHNDSVLLMQ